MNDIQEKQEAIEMDTEPEVPLLKPKRKMKKFPRTEKQQEAFKITMQKRAENVARRKELKKIEAAKLLIQSESLTYNKLHIKMRLQMIIQFNNPLLI